MFGSLRLGKVFGIDLFVHGTFWLLPLFVFLSAADDGLGGALFEVAVILAIFACVALHEVGHALAGAYYGIPTRDITLYPLGGIARLERIPERPGQEVVIALAGPAVNVAIALLLLGVVLLAGTGLGFDWTHAPGVAELFLGRLLIANVALVLFNLLPAFPMDGGRVLRALLSTRLGRLPATRWAARVGAVLAAGFVLLGVAAEPIQPGLILIGVVVFLLGQAELAQVRLAEAAREWERAFGPVVHLPPFDLPPVPAPDGFTGWKWDPARRVWGEYLDGVLVREMTRL